MRFVTGYLIGYFALILGALLALWQGGALPHIGAVRVLVALVIAVGFGLLLAVASGWRPAAGDAVDEDGGG
jgi:hypothetical protein